METEEKLVKLSRRLTTLLICMTFWISAAGEDPNSQSSSSDGQQANQVTQVDPTYIPMIAAVICGFGLLLAMVSLFLVLALVYRHIGDKNAMIYASKQPRLTYRDIYAHREMQSTQNLVVQRGNDLHGFGSLSSVDFFPSSTTSSQFRSGPQDSSSSVDIFPPSTPSSNAQRSIHGFGSLSSVERFPQIPPSNQVHRYNRGGGLDGDNHHRSARHEMQEHYYRPVKLNFTDASTRRTSTRI